MGFYKQSIYSFSSKTGRPKTILKQRSPHGHSMSINSQSSSPIKWPNLILGQSHAINGHWPSINSPSPPQIQWSNTTLGQRSGCYKKPSPKLVIGCLYTVKAQILFNGPTQYLGKNHRTNAQKKPSPDSMAQHSTLARIMALTAIGLH